MEAIGAEVDQKVQTSPERPLSSAEALTMRAVVHLAGERFPDAHACLDEALRLDPKLAWAHEVRAALAWAEDDPVVAREAVERALALEPGRPVAARLQKRLSGPPTVKGAERLCDGGDLEACLILGGWLIDGNGAAPDPSRGVALIDRACTGGNVEACRQLSWRYRQGTGVEADGARAVAFLEKACGAGDSQACLAAASDHQTGRGVPADPAAATRMLESACTHGEKAGVPCPGVGPAERRGNPPRPRAGGGSVRGRVPRRRRRGLHAAGASLRGPGRASQRPPARGGAAREGLRAWRPAGLLQPGDAAPGERARRRSPNPSARPKEVISHTDPGAAAV